MTSVDLMTTITASPGAKASSSAASLVMAAVIFCPSGRLTLTVDMQPPIGHVYGYELEPIDGGTMVTSYYDWSNIHENYRDAAASIFPVISETNLRATLGILARVAAPGQRRPGATETAKGGADLSDR